MRRQLLRIELDVESDAELEALEGALLAARAGEISQARRRSDRLSFGYGSDSSRASMSAEIEQSERRWAMLDRLLEALRSSASAE